jgi:hypothetical protein
MKQMGEVSWLVDEAVDQKKIAPLPCGECRVMG